MTPCIGWHAPNNCPHHHGDLHGCKHPDPHTGNHECPCGATILSRPRDRKKTA